MLPPIIGTYLADGRFRSQNKNPENFEDASAVYTRYQGVSWMSNLTKYVPPVSTGECQKQCQLLGSSCAGLVSDNDTCKLIKSSGKSTGKTMLSTRLNDGTYKDYDGFSLDVDKILGVYAKQIKNVESRDVCKVMCNTSVGRCNAVYTTDSITPDGMREFRCYNLALRPAPGAANNPGPTTYFKA